MIILPRYLLGVNNFNGLFMQILAHDYFRIIYLFFFFLGCRIIEYDSKGHHISIGAEEYLSLEYQREKKMIVEEMPNRK